MDAFSTHLPWFHLGWAHLHLFTVFTCLLFLPTLLWPHFPGAFKYGDLRDLILQRHWLNSERPNCRPFCPFMPASQPVCGTVPNHVPSTLGPLPEPPRQFLKTSSSGLPVCFFSSRHLDSCQVPLGRNRKPPQLGLTSSSYQKTTRRKSPHLNSLRLVDRSPSPSGRPASRDLAQAYNKYKLCVLQPQNLYSSLLIKKLAISRQNSKN